MKNQSINQHGQFALARRTKKRKLGGGPQIVSEMLNDSDNRHRNKRLQ